MIDYSLDNYMTPYDLFDNNCGDLVGGALEAGGFKGGTEGTTIPNQQFIATKKENGGVTP
jgi:hypothetical protein